MLAPNLSLLMARRVKKSTVTYAGVPQVSMLGPLLFLAFINDLPACVFSSTTCTRLFADDSVLNSFTPMSWWQRLMTTLPFTPMSCSQWLFDLKVNKHLDPLTCHWFTWHIDLDDFWPGLELLPAADGPESTSENFSCKFCTSFPGFSGFYLVQSCSIC